MTNALCNSQLNSRIIPTRRSSSNDKCEKPQDKWSNDKKDQRRDKGVERIDSTALDAEGVIALVLAKIQGDLA